MVNHNTLQFKCFTYDFVIPFSAARHPFPSVLDDISREVLDNLQESQENAAIYAESLNTNLYPMLDICSIEIPKLELLNEHSREEAVRLIPIINLGSIENIDQTSLALLNKTIEQIQLDSNVQSSYPIHHNAEIRHRRPSKFVFAQHSIWGTILQNIVVQGVFISMLDHFKHV